LTSVEQSLVEYVGRGELLDLAAEDRTADEAAMRSWGDDRTCRASVIRDILRGRLAADPDPRGLRLRGARICGRLDLENLTTDVKLDLRYCLLEDGVLARDARLASIRLAGCRLEHAAEPPLFADGLTCRVLDLKRARIIGHVHAGAVRLNGARIDDILDCAGAHLGNDSGPALEADALQVGQSMYLHRGFTATGAGELGAVRLLATRIGINLYCDGARLANDSGTALAADGLQVGRSMVLGSGFTAIGAGELGAVRLLAVRIGGQLRCDGADLRNDSGPALVAESLQVGQKMLLRSGFTATGAGELGAVRLTSAHISGSLECEGANLRNDSGPALSAQMLEVGQSTHLGGGFTATGAGETHSVVDLRGARVGVLFFDPARLEHAADPHLRFAVEELTYAGVPQRISAQKWLDLLRDGTPRYAGQPYQQLAAGYRALGDERQAREILMAQRHAELTRPPNRWTERLWGWTTKVTLGYGYKPWRALWFLAGVLAVSCVLAVALGSHGALAQTDKTATPTRPCTVIQQVSVGLDLNLPVGTSVARASCDLTKNSASATGAWLTGAGWVLRLLAWVFAALFIAGFTSAVRKT
jgi:hypothetical protein